MPCSVGAGSGLAHDHERQVQSAKASVWEKGESRRAKVRAASILGLGVAGAASLAGGASWFDFFTRWREAEMPADIFKGDAPKGELWELWRRRGWVKEASHHLKLGRNVQCKVCPNNCLDGAG